MSDTTICAELNRKAGTTGLTAAAAANVWAGTSGLTLASALNVKAGNVMPNYAPVGAVLNQLAGITDPSQYVGPAEAASRL